MSEPADALDPAAADDDRAAEQALRPRSLEEFVGQPVLRSQLGLLLEAARRRGRVPDHVLLAGPPGLGKTTLAMIIGREVGADVRVTSGPAIQHAGDLAAILSSLDEGDVLFVDEIHRMARPAEELLYVAMEDFRVDVVVGKGPGATAIPLPLPPFTLVGATTRAGMLPGPLRDRFGFTGHLDYYDVADLVTVVRRSAELVGCDLDGAAADEIARRSRGTPRIANRLLRRVRDYADVHLAVTDDHSSVTSEHPSVGHAAPARTVGVDAAGAALDLFQVDRVGLDRLDRAVLDAVCRRFGGGPVGVTTLALTVGEEPETVETVAEPYLVREGFLARTPRGRVALPRAWEHLGLPPALGSGGLHGSAGLDGPDPAGRPGSAPLGGTSSPAEPTAATLPLDGLEPDRRLA